MSPKTHTSHNIFKARYWLLPLLLFALLLPTSLNSANATGPISNDAIFQPDAPPILQAGPADITAACAGGPVIDGVTLDECYDESFLVGGVTKTIRVWYTNVHTTATRTQDGTTYTLEHWIDTDLQAQQVAAWGRQAWERYYFIFGHHPYDTGCSNRINVRMEDGIGWSGIAYWGNPGSCWIGIDSPVVRGGSGQWVVYHEFQHYLQYSYNSGCYGFLRPGYPDDADFVEGYADLAADAVDNTLDAAGYGGITYDPSSSMYAKSYGNLFNKYFIEQLGKLYLPTEAWHHMDALRSHYEQCDVQDNLYVLNTLIPTLKPGVSEEKFFTNFFAANWAKNWANAGSQGELVYFDDDGNPYGNTAPLTKDETISTVTPRTYSGENTPDKWAAKYYQVSPQSGCNYVQAKVDGAPGANLGINLMAAKTTAPTSVQRFSKIGEDFSRTFLGFGVYNKILAEVNAFGNNFGYDVALACVTPSLNIVEPRQTNFAMVGDPSSPIAFLARFEIKDGANPILGVQATAISAKAGSDPITLVPGSFQLVGAEYWVVMIPPVKPPGTSFVNLTICLDGTICDTETNALLYVNPGNTDQALVFDGSGSMSIQDIAGEGTRLENAKKAGKLMADLLRAGDRVLVTSFSAIDNPVGCGLPGGSGNCPLDIQTPLARTDVTGPGIIPTVHTAIDGLTAREWTPIGAALRDAKNKLLAPSANLNPKHIILLSDGEENVNPLYGGDAALRSELHDSGVVIDTIGLSGDATPALLAQIAADTGGTFRFVPSSSGTLMPASADQKNFLAQSGLPPAMIDQVNTVVQPGPLGLDDVYDFFDTKNQGAARLSHTNFTMVPDNTFQTIDQYVDDSVNALRIVVGGKQEDNDISGSCSGYHRDVEVFAPWLGPNDRWYPVSPRNPAYTPPGWDIRNSVFDDVVIIPSPTPGLWRVRTRYSYIICLNGSATPLSPEAPQVLESDFMMNISAESNIVLLGRFLSPIVNNQGNAGDVVPIVATLLDKNGAIPGALVAALIEKPGSADLTLLLDDGLHDDGEAADGIYGWDYPLTTVGGSYNVRIVAWIWDPVAAMWKTREWLGGFFINGPALDDLDKDGMPDPWERRCKLDPNINDAQLDKDFDALVNLDEFTHGTSPCNPDTDHGGEKDGSEVAHNRNPLWAPDDKIGRLNWYDFTPLNNRIIVRWTPPISSTYMLLSVNDNPDESPRGIDLPNTGIFTVTNVVNDKTYFLRLAPGNSQDQAQGPYSEEEGVTPKADPDMPSGAMVINKGAATTTSLQVLLDITSTDTPLPGLAEAANAHRVGMLAQRFNLVSAGIEMRISNDQTFPGAQWQPLAQFVPWWLDPGSGKVKRVYVQFRDAAMNESLIVLDDIVFEPTIYLPLVRK